MSFAKSRILVPKLKDSYGPMLTSLLNQGIKVDTPQKKREIVTSFGQENKVEKAIWFNSLPLTDKLDFPYGWWMCDLRDPRIFPKIHVDTIFLCNKHFMKDYSDYFGAKVHYMPQIGYEVDMAIGRDVNWDIVFIGEENQMYHSNRKEYFDVLKEFNFKWIRGEKFTKDQNWIYYKTPISLAISPQFEGYTSNRLYNILSSGGFCLTLWFPGIEQLFTNHHHLVWFKNAEDLKLIIKYYLAHPEKRQEIANNGKKLYYEKYSASHKLEQMLALIK